MSFIFEIKLEDFVIKKIEKQAWKLSAIKGEPNLSILWEIRQIHLKKSISSQKVTSNLTKVFLDKKAVSEEKPLLPKSHFWPKSLIKFDPFLTDLIQKKIKKTTLISILSVNVTTFYSNIFWLTRNPIDQVWSSLIKFDQVWSSLINFDQLWTDLIQKNLK